MSELDVNEILKNYDFDKIKTNKIPLTKFEKTRILGERASQIENGSNIFISNPERFSNAYTIAEEELNLKKIPFIIKRNINGIEEYIRLNDLL